MFWRYYNQFTVWWDLWQTFNGATVRCNSERMRRSPCRVSLIKSYSGSRGNVAKLWLISSCQFDWFYSTFSGILRTSDLRGLQPVAHSGPSLLDVDDSGRAEKEKQNEKSMWWYKKKNVRRGTTKAFDENLPLSRVKKPTQHCLFLF